MDFSNDWQVAIVLLSMVTTLIVVVGGIGFLLVSIMFPKNELDYYSSWDDSLNSDE